MINAPTPHQQRKVAASFFIIATFRRREQTGKIEGIEIFEEFCFKQSEQQKI